MKFSIFQQNLNSWKGSSLILGILEEDIETKLKKVEFLIDSRILLSKINHKKLIKLMQSDKKSNQGRLKFILLEKIGRAKIKVIKNNQVIEKAIKNSLFY